jgi:gliding motility-associated-like protein
LQKPAFITVHPNPIASFVRTPDITTLAYPTIEFYDQSLGAVKRLWNFDDPGSGLANNSLQKEPTHTYSAEGEYWPVLFVENEWGCVDSVTNRIIINPTWEEYIPTAFSPNGDGHNDFFRPMGFNIDFTEYSMYIYDRWGKEIFDTHDIEVGWDGRVNGQGEIVQQDVYVYLIILKDVNGLEHQFIGHVTVVK